MGGQSEEETEETFKTTIELTEEGFIFDEEVICVSRTR
jgi:hypothetical protein